MTVCMTTSDSHARYWLFLEETWGKIRARGAGASALHAWQLLELTVKTHADHEVCGRCAGCGAGYCECLVGEMLLPTLGPSCRQCDMRISPNPYNPRCRWLVKHFGIRLMGAESLPNDDEDLEPPVLDVSRTTPRNGDKDAQFPTAWGWDK